MGWLSQTAQYMEIKDQLRTQKLILKAKEDELKELKWCHELLYQRHLLMENDTVHLKEKMEDVTQAKRQQKNLALLVSNGVRNRLIELTERLRVKSALSQKLVTVNGRHKKTLLNKISAFGYYRMHIALR